ncbi:hypothetical protein FDZ73_24105 [bacterium]|nr:MAG: hypothetical protein FDZ73_24105 [bacterium]
MSKNHEGDYKAFIQHSRAYYSKVIPETKKWSDEVTFGLYSPKGGTSGEMAMRWYRLGDKDCAKLEVFEDAFHALGQLKDLVDALAEVDSKLIQPDEFCKLLTALGFIDQTETEKPCTEEERKARNMAAAAPDLYEALKFVKEFYETVPDIEGDPGYEKVKAALAKAEGRG